MFHDYDNNPGDELTILDSTSDHQSEDKDQGETELKVEYRVIVDGEQVLETTNYEEAAAKHDAEAKKCNRFVIMESDFSRLFEYRRQIASPVIEQEVSEAEESIGTI